MDQNQQINLQTHPSTFSLRRVLQVLCFILEIIGTLVYVSMLLGGSEEPMILVGVTILGVAISATIIALFMTFSSILKCSRWEKVLYVINFIPILIVYMYLVPRSFMIPDLIWITSTYSIVLISLIYLISAYFKKTDKYLRLSGGFCF